MKQGLFTLLARVPREVRDPLIEVIQERLEATFEAGRNSHDSLNR